MFEILRGVNVGIDGIKFTTPRTAGGLRTNTITKSDIAGNVYWEATIEAVSRMIGVEHLIIFVGSATYDAIHVPNPEGDAGCCFYGYAADSHSVLVGYLNGDGELEWIYDLYYIVPYPRIDYYNEECTYSATLLGADATGKIYIGLKSANHDGVSLDLWSPPATALTNLYESIEPDSPSYYFRRGGVSRSGEFTFVLYGRHWSFGRKWEVYKNKDVILVLNPEESDTYMGIYTRIDESGNVYYRTHELYSEFDFS